MSEAKSGRGLAHLPVPLFAAVLGIGGLALAYRRTALVWGGTSSIADALAIVAALLLLGLLTAYAAKWLRHPAAARAELRHPMRMTFVPAITVGTVIVATALAGPAPGLATVLWWIGALGHLVATIVVLHAWTTRPDITTAHVTPAWFIPVVGNVITPLAAPSVGSIEVAWIAFGVGLGFWIALLPLVGFRLVLGEEPLPVRLRPTLVILIAPPAVAGLSLSVLTGDVGVGVRVLWAMALAFTALVLLSLRRLLAAPFGLPWWAATFPLTALASLAVVMASATGSRIYAALAVGLLASATVVVLAVSTLTVRAALRGEICVPE